MERIFGILEGVLVVGALFTLWNIVWNLIKIELEMRK